MMKITWQAWWFVKNGSYKISKLAAHRFIPSRSGNLKKNVNTYTVVVIVAHIFLWFYVQKRLKHLLWVGDMLPIQFSYKLANRVILSQIPKTIARILVLKTCPKFQECTLHGSTRMRLKSLQNVIQGLLTQPILNELNFILSIFGQISKWAALPVTSPPCTFMAHL